MKIIFKRNDFSSYISSDTSCGQARFIIFGYVCSQERDSLQQRLNEAVEENATLNFEHARVKDGYTGPLRRMVSYTSTEFLSGSTQQLAGARGRC